MHELSVATALVDLVLEQARQRHASRVLRVEVRVGELAGVEPDLLASAYGLAREGTVCQDATLEIRRVPVRWACPTCERALGPEALLRCDACGVPARLAEGAELLLDRIEMEVD